MKPLLAAITAFVFAVPAFSATVLVQKAKNQSSGLTSVSSWFTNAPQKGDVLIAVGFGRAGDTLSISDTLGNAWTAGPQSNATGGGQLRLWWAVNTIAAADTVTLSEGTATDDLNLQIFEVAGLSGVPLDVSGSATGQGPNISVSTSAAISQPNEYVFAAFGDWSNGSNITWALCAPYVGEQTTANGGAGTDGTAAGDAVLSNASGVQTITATINASDIWYALVASFKPAATSTSHSVSLTWMPSSTVGADYNVYRSTVSGGPYSGVAGQLPTTAFTDTNVANGTTYYYVVTAICGLTSVNCAGESTPSSEVSATIPAITTAPGTPTGISATVN
jgi:hypothetical protein